MEVSVRAHDTSSNMPFFTDMHTVDLRSSLRLSKNEPMVDNGDLKYNSCTKFTDNTATESTDELKYFVELIPYAQ